MSHTYIACDLGAESGRVVLGTLDGGRVTLEEIHRFPNDPVRVLGSLRWDLLRIFADLKTGLAKAAARAPKSEGVSVDAWGVDYVLVKGREPMVGVPFHYRDARNERSYEEALKLVSRETIFAETGIQFMPFNTVYQLVAEAEESPELLSVADQFLMIGDYFNYLFSGVACVDQSNASTTQAYNPRTGAWCEKLIARLGLPANIFPKIVPCGTNLGPMLDEVAPALAGVPVIATCSHDTGAAVAAVPAEVGHDWAYLSSGTWSLMGVELPEPLINRQVCEENFTNEIGYGNSARFLKNLAGLWILQECRRAWLADGEEYDYGQLTKLAREAEPFRSLIHPNAAPFLRPGDMPGKVAAYCRETGQPVPETPGQFSRCILESLALLYGRTLAIIEKLTDRRIARLHIVGGGSKNELLNQFAANATGRTVLAGPVEGTAIGNLLIQALTLKHIESLAAVRKVVRDSFEIETFKPADSSEWQAACERFGKLE